jgi:tetratricopeptide (TPR) repeat protein
MRLLEIQHDGALRLTKDLHGDDSVPAYAILSHTWHEDEVTFDDLKHETGTHKAGYEKICFSAQQAQHDGLRYFWVDTCCINKADAVELQDAINSMFRWYRDAAKCYVFLSDVPGPGQELIATTGVPAWEQAFRSSRWFTRGWTLQEMLAPRHVSFFSRDWKHLGDRRQLGHCIQEITGIPIAAISGASLDNFSVDEKLSWSSRRQTTRKEDRAYSLLGIFNVFMSLIYGEGEENAFRRLKKKIEKAVRDGSPDFLRAVPEWSGAQEHTPVRKPCYTLPFQKNRHFVGRRHELETLNQKLFIDCDCERMTIIGLGGTGKTQLALQFAYMVKETMSAVSVFWVPALSMESFEQACRGIIEALDIPYAAGGDEDVREVVQQHLSSSRAGRWLMVVDNADDVDIFFRMEQSRGIVDYLPKSDTGVIMYTTRTPEVAESTRGDVIELAAMDREDAVAFLTKLLRKDLLHNDATITELLDELACLPLAIAQAAAYLNRNRMSVAKYLQLLRSTEQDMVALMSREFRDDTRYHGSANAVATTWVVSFSQIRERDALAADLLAFMSCVEWKAIPRSLLPKAQAEWQTEEAIGTLCGYSFLARRGGNDREGEERKEEGDVQEEWYDIHRLVHLATRIWISKHGDAARVLGEAVQQVAGVFPSDDYDNRVVWRAYLPHALRLLDSRQQSSIAERSELCLLVGQSLQVDGRIREAVKWLEESCRWREGLSEDDSDLLLSQHELAGAYHADGQIQKAVELLERVVMIQERVLAEEHPSRLASQHELARAYEADGQVQKAVELLERVVMIRERVLAEEHPDRLASQHELARAYATDGQVQKAVELLERVVMIRERVLAEEHPDRLASQHELARVYAADGQVQKALQLLERVVMIRERVLAEEHPSRLASQHVLAGAYRADGQVQKAVELLERVVIIRERVLAEEHPDRLASQHVLAGAYHADRQVQKAVELLERVVMVEERVLAEEHPDRLASQHELARAYRADGQVQKAVELLEHVVKISARSMRADHPSLLVSVKLLARIRAELSADSAKILLPA